MCFSQHRISVPISERLELEEGCVHTLPAWEEGLHLSSGLSAVAN